MKQLFFFVLLLALCSFGIQAKEALPTVSPLKVFEIRPGQVQLIKEEIPSGAEVQSYTCHKKKLPFSVKNNVLQSFVMASYFTEPTRFTCSLELSVKGKAETKELYQVTVVPYEYKKERLKVAPKRVTLSKKDLRRYQKERKILDAIYSGFSSDVFFEQNFKKPSDLPLSSDYGTKRVFNNVRSTQHLGTDFRAPVGTPVHSSNRGKVVFAGDLFFSGNTILIDHGLSIFTMYAHLSKIVCKQGDIVEKDALIAYSGKTGRVSGPHLHWGVKVDGSWVDGFTLPLD